MYFPTEAQEPAWTAKVRLGSDSIIVMGPILGRFPTLEEYKAAVEGINLTSFAPPSKDLARPAIPLKAI